MTSDNELSPHSFSNLVEVLKDRAVKRPEQRIYTFLVDGEEEEISMTLGGLHHWARTIGAHLQKRWPVGQRALLLYPPGLEYIQAFFGCLSAGLIAVPAYPPDPNRMERTLPRLLSILKDCGAKVILTTEMIQSMASFLAAQAPELGDLEWVATDTLSLIPDNGWNGPEITPKDIAFLQYTSGSTGSPKGVILSHENLIYNSQVIQKNFRNFETTHDVSWLPPYHDMGLIGDILGTLYGGGTLSFMSPLHFLQKPLRWLRAISRTRADISGGPNFAYELCTRKVSEEDKKDLDLSCWELAYCGAEPISAETLEQFAQAFAPCGFRKEFLYPCYGLAEGTLLVTGGNRKGGFETRAVPKKAFQKDQIATNSQDPETEVLHWVACGKEMPGQKIKIIRPDTLEECREGEVGEIWLKGPSVAKGYWNQMELSQATFVAHIKSNEEGPFLRTGDLGFLEKGKLYVTGRLKDLIIIRGANHYPQDLERTVESCHPVIRPGCVAAFSVPSNFEEKLVLALEVDPSRSGDSTQDEARLFGDILQAIQQALSKNYELEVFAVNLLRKGAIPKTSSGKLQRAACRKAYLNQTLERLHHWQKKTQQQVPDKPRSNAKLTKTKIKPRIKLAPLPENIRPWLIAQITSHLGMAPEEFDPGRPFSDYGLASKDAVELSGELGDWLGSQFSPALLWKYPSVEALATYLRQSNNVKIS